MAAQVTYFQIGREVLEAAEKGGGGLPPALADASGEGRSESQARRAHVVDLLRGGVLQVTVKKPWAAQDSGILYAKCAMRSFLGVEKGCFCHEKLSAEDASGILHAGRIPGCHGVGKFCWGGALVFLESGIVLGRSLLATSASTSRAMTQATRVRLSRR